MDRPFDPTDELERLLGEAAAALEAGDTAGTARAVSSALALVADGRPPVQAGRLLPLHARLLSLAERETARLSDELASLGNSRRASGAYRGLRKPV